jgi:hypothetical protein
VNLPVIRAILDRACHFDFVANVLFDLFFDLLFDLQFDPQVDPQVDTRHPVAGFREAGGRGPAG